MGDDRFILSHARACELAGVTRSGLASAIRRGTLIEAQALIGDTVRRGVTLASAARHWQWDTRTVDAILATHGVPHDSADYHYLTARDEG